MHPGPLEPLVRPRLWQGPTSHILFNPTPEPKSLTLTHTIVPAGPTCL